MKEKNIKVAKIVLKTIAVAGLLSVVMVAPNALQVLKMFNPGLKNNTRRTYYFLNVVDKLLSKGFIRFIRKKKTCYLALTGSGEKELARYMFFEKHIEIPKRWDGKFRLVIFDIQETNRNLREGFRKWLKQLGFIRLQHSVWVYPYECQEIVLMIKTHFGIGKRILYITADYVENNQWLKEKFNL